MEVDSPPNLSNPTSRVCARCGNPQIYHSWVEINDTIGLGIDTPTEQYDVTEAFCAPDFYVIIRELLRKRGYVVSETPLAQHRPESQSIPGEGDDD